MNNKNEDEYIINIQQQNQNIINDQMMQLRLSADATIYQARNFDNKKIINSPKMNKSILHNKMNK